MCIVRSHSQVESRYAETVYRSIWIVGIAHVIRSAAMIGLGGFLLLQIPTTPQLTMQIVLIGGLLVSSGLYLLIGHKL